MCPIEAALCVYSARPSRYCLQSLLAKRMTFLVELIVDLIRLANLLGIIFRASANLCPLPFLDEFPGFVADIILPFDFLGNRELPVKCL
jgi:hypothetical protein